MSVVKSKRKQIKGRESSQNKGNEKQQRWTPLDIDLLLKNSEPFLRVVDGRSLASLLFPTMQPAYPAAQGVYQNSAAMQE